MPKTLDFPLRRCRPSEDVIPFSECRNNLSTYIARVRETRRPVLITQNGRAAAGSAGDQTQTLEAADEQRRF